MTVVLKNLSVFYGLVCTGLGWYNKKVFGGGVRMSDQVVTSSVNVLGVLFVGRRGNARSIQLE